MTTTTNTDNKTTTTTADDSLFRGRTKTIWNDKGQRILVPDLDSNSVEAIAAANSVSPYVYRKTVEDVISSTDRFQYDRLKTDADRYAFIRNMITGINSNTYSLYDHEIGGGGTYVERDFRSLDTIIQTLVNNKKVFLDTESDNLYHYKYAVDNNLARVKCAHCSTVVGTGPDGLIKHMWLHTQARR
jgi:hypothetical protein